MGARRAWASEDARERVLDGCFSDPQGHGSAVGPRIGSQHENAAGAGATYRQTNRFGEAEPSLGTVTKAELPRFVPGV